MAILCVLCAAVPNASRANFVPPPSSLTETDVDTIVLQAIHEASARGKPATIAVVDRVGNVLTVTQMTGAPTAATVTSGRPVDITMLGVAQNGLEGLAVPTTMAAIAKAVTGAYLSSNGNAFSTRTANQIIQEHFNPGVNDTPAGPLFGVQFSQLPCSDFNTGEARGRGQTNAGPHRSPLGFSADSGGLPIYKNGILAGGIGVMTKNTYSGDLDIFDVDHDDDEIIAIAGVTGYEAPSNITGPNISVGGITLRYTDATTADLAAAPATIGSYAPMAVRGFFPGAAIGHLAIPGLSYGDPASGVTADGTLGPVLYPGVEAFVFTDGKGNVLYQPQTGMVPGGGVAITAAEAQQLMTSALGVAFRARAQIRQPFNSHMEVTVTVVDVDGNVLAQARTPDAPIFGADVSRQKARTSALFSRPDAAATISAIQTRASTDTQTFADYIARSQSLIGPTAFADGIAWSEVAIGNVARPFYPDGIDGNPPGSLSLPFGTRWSVFSTGLQTDLILGDVLRSALKGGERPKAGCAHSGFNLASFGAAGDPELPVVSGGKTQLANGLQIFSGSVPIYRGNTLVGGIGVSGDGIQQDSLVAFLGLQNGPPSLTNAPTAIRADQLTPGGVRLRYINCPFAPFLDSTEQNPC
jgi:uncharacterized protein GlcG (DUF336 family)